MCRTKRLEIRLAPSELEDIQDRANDLHLTVSAYARQVLLGIVKPIQPTITVHDDAGQPHSFPSGTLCSRCERIRRIACDDCRKLIP